jgi:acyl-CoA reductase-like NAD-dependent aldehyde dehydrogenase
LIRPAEVERVDAWVREAIVAGATLLCGGSRIGRAALRPAVLWNSPLDAKLVTQEVFGPVVSVIPVPNLDEAIRLANQGAYAFQSSIFTGKLRHALAAADRLEASAVLVNDPTTFRVDWMPFGGYRESGIGRSGIPHTYRDYTREKLLVLREG